MKILTYIEDDTSVGTIGNGYGGLNILEKEDKYYWSIENYDGDDWVEIRKDAYLMLLKGIEVETA